MFDPQVTNTHKIAQILIRVGAFEILLSSLLESPTKNGKRHAAKRLSGKRLKPASDSQKN